LVDLVLEYVQRSSDVEESTIAAKNLARADVAAFRSTPWADAPVAVATKALMNVRRTILAECRRLNAADFDI
jgi:hypothetical protein